MKIKSVDIAKKLNISKAAVSLALNNKPGVSEATRKRVFQCIEEMNDGYRFVMEEISVNKKIIKLISVNKNLGHSGGLELDLWGNPMTVFAQETRKAGCILSLSYVSSQKNEIENVIREANDENVAGVILHAIEMSGEEFALFKKIRKPMVIFDNDLGDDNHCVYLEGINAVSGIVDLLVFRGCKNIVYLGNQFDIFYFQQRRVGFKKGLRKNRLELKNNSIFMIGDRIDCIYENMKKYLATEKLPDAFIMENYQVSVGVVRALKEYGISIPDDVSLVGIDEIPEYLTGGIRLSAVRFDAVERASLAMMLLEQEIQGRLSAKVKLISNGRLIQGNSIK